ncbi:MAG: ABC-F family ATP-binding cassette domain-containing protein [Gemmatimonadota bacterium]
MTPIPVSGDLLAMILLTLEGVGRWYGADPVLEGVTFTLSSGEKVGVMGRNGSGKSTLLRIAAGVEAPDRGEVRRGTSLRMGYLSQDPEFRHAATVLDAALSSDDPVLMAVAEHRHAVQALEALGTHDAGTGTERLLDRVSAASQRVDALRAWDVESEARSILDRLGLPGAEHPVETLSGGQRKRVALARALLGSPDLVILDEPTNHLDAPAVEWLESWLARFTGGLLLVTHDRYFLDRVTGGMLEVEGGAVTRYLGNYTRYLELKEEEEAREEASERTRQSLMRRELAWLRRGAKARTTKQKARVDRAEALLSHEGPSRSDELELDSASRRMGRKGLELHGVSGGYPDEVLFRDVDLTLQKGDRLGIIGPNGSGKSTLLEILASRLAPLAGRREVGETVAVGYYDQESRALDDGMRVLEYVKEMAELVHTADGSVITASQMLERFLFTPEAQYTRVGSLSGGERRRLYLLRLLMGSPNVLLLDEPTNDLDIPTLVALESYLDGFAGALVVVSHDRYFLDRTVNHLLHLPGDGTVEQIPGNYSVHLERQKSQEAARKAALREDAAGARAGSASRARAGKEAGFEKRGGSGPGGSAPASAIKTRQLTFQERKELGELEARIALIESRVEEIGRELTASGADYAAAAPLYDELQELNERLEADMKRWGELAERA